MPFQLYVDKGNSVCGYPIYVLVTEENRPPSRQGDLDRSRSRADYDRDSYYRDRKKGNS